MNELILGILINFIYSFITFICKRIFKCFKSINIKFNLTKIQFHLYLLTLVLYTAYIFADLPKFTELGFGYFLTTLLAFCYLYFSVVMEYDKLLDSINNGKGD